MSKASDDVGRKIDAIVGAWMKVEGEEADRRIRITIAQIIRMVRRPDGRHLADLAILARVPGATSCMVHDVRRELMLYGVLRCELSQPGFLTEGDV